MKKVIALFLITTLLTTGCATKKDEKSSKVNLDGKIIGEINVSCYDTMVYLPYIEEAVKKFETKYPNTKINVSSFSKMPEMKTVVNDDGSVLQLMTSENDEQAKSDYINKVNTEIMSSNGADIYAMDILPSYKYAEASQIENLNDYIKVDGSFNKADYRENILKAVEYKGEQYIFPIDYSFEYLAYDKTLFGEEEINEINKKNLFTFDELFSIAKSSFENKNEEIKMFEFFGSEHLFRTQFNMNYSKFIDIENRKADFTNGEFISLLENFNIYNEKGYVKDSMPKNIIETGESIPKINLEQNDEQFFYKNKMQMGILGDVYKNENINYITTFGSNSTNDEVFGILSNDKGEVSSSYSQAYAINSSSKNKKLAWEFIKFLASEEMQMSANLFSRPINKSAFDKKAKEEITGEFYEKMNSDAIKTEADRALTEDETKAYDKYLTLLNELSNAININFIQDTIVNDIVFNEVTNYFDGKKSAKEVASQVQNKVELYLSE